MPWINILSPQHHLLPLGGLCSFHLHGLHLHHPPNLKDPLFPYTTPRTVDTYPTLRSQVLTQPKVTSVGHSLAGPSQLPLTHSYELQCAGFTSEPLDLLLSLLCFLLAQLEALGGQGLCPQPLRHCLVCSSQKVSDGLKGIRRSEMPPVHILFCVWGESKAQ